MIDASTGATGTSPDRSVLQGCARYFVAVGVVLLLAACSSIRLGYNNADTLLLYSLNSYFDLDARQEGLARERVQALLAWHRSTQLSSYAQFLADERRRIDGHVSAADVTRLQQQMNAKLVTIGERAAPDVAALALTLAPAQIQRCADKLAKDASKARRELASISGKALPEDRIKRLVERAESWFGSLTDEQEAMVRAAVAARPASERWWVDERERRQNDFVRLLRRIQQEKPTPGTAERWLREYLAQLDAPSDPERRAALTELRQANAELVARLINSATPAQRQTLAKKLRGYAEDFVALAAVPANGG